MNNYKCIVPYVSEWDGGTAINTIATVDIITGEVTDIQTVKVDGLESLESEYILMNGEIVYVYHDEHGYEHWADIKGEYSNADAQEPDESL